MIRIDQPLLAVVLAAFCCAAHPFEIIESRFRVEVQAGKFVDQAVLRCADGHVITVPWEAKFADACGEDLFGNVTKRQRKAVPAQETSSAQAQARDAALPQQAPDLSEPQPAHPTVESTLPDPLPTKPAALGSANALLDPASREVLKRYERCRKQVKASARCAAERDRALAALDSPDDSANPSVTSQPLPTSADAEAAPTGSSTAVAAAQQQPSYDAPATPAPVGVDGQRALAEAKIADEFTACMRMRPKLECEQTRAKAIMDLDTPRAPKRKRTKRPDVSADSSPLTVR